MDFLKACDLLDNGKKQNKSIQFYIAQLKTIISIEKRAERKDEKQTAIIEKEISLLQGLTLDRLLFNVFINIAQVIFHNINRKL